MPVNVHGLLPASKSQVPLPGGGTQVKNLFGLVVTTRSIESFAVSATTG